MSTPVLKFGYDEHSDGAFISLDGQIQWWEQSFDSIDQYLGFVTLPDPVTLAWGEPTLDESQQLREMLGDEDE